MTEPYPPPTPEERQLRASRLAGGGGIGPGLAPGVPGVEPPGGFLRGRSAGVPNLVWIGGATLLGIIGLIWYFRHKASTSADTSTGTVDQSSTAAGLDTGQFDSLTAQLRDIQGQESQEIPTPATPAPVTTPTAPNPPPPPTHTTPRPAVNYTIVSGDILSRIAAKFHEQPGDLYQKNAAVIEAAARAHHHTSSRGGPNNSLGWWIFPGTRLVV